MKKNIRRIFDQYANRLARMNESSPEYMDALMAYTQAAAELERTLTDQQKQLLHTLSQERANLEYFRRFHAFSLGWRLPRAHD